MNKIRIESDFGTITDTDHLYSLEDREISELLRPHDQENSPITITTRSVHLKKLKKLILEKIKPTHLIEYKKILEKGNKVIF